VVRFVVGRARV